MPPPAPVAPQAPPWWLILLGGSGLGSAIALIWNWLCRRLLRRMLLGAAPRPGWPPQQAWPAHALPPALAQQPLQLPGQQQEALGDVEREVAGRSRAPAARQGLVARLPELAVEMRRHTAETCEATASLRRTMEQQQRQYQATISDFQRKLADVVQKKQSTGSRRIEISPESLKALEGIVSAHDQAAGGSGAASTGAADTWLGRADRSLQSLLSAAAAKADARRALQTVSMIMHNLVQSPTERKYREVSTSSSRFQETFGSPDSGAADLLHLAGLKLIDQAFIFPEDGNLDEASRMRDFIHSALRDCDARWEQASGGGGSSSVGCNGIPVASKLQMQGSAQPVLPRSAAGECPEQSVASASSATAPALDGSRHGSSGAHNAGGMHSGAGHLVAAPAAGAAASSERSRAQPWASGVSGQVAAHPAEAQGSSPEPQSGG